MPKINEKSVLDDVLNLFIGSIQYTLKESMQLGSGVLNPGEPVSKGSYNMTYYASLTKLSKFSKAQFHCMKLGGESYASFVGL